MTNTSLLDPDNIVGSTGICSLNTVQESLDDISVNAVVYEMVTAIW